jgi:hypothetical protein
MILFSIGRRGFIDLVGDIDGLEGEGEGRVGFGIDGITERNEDTDDHDCFGLSCWTRNDPDLQFLRMSLHAIQPSPYLIRCWYADAFRTKRKNSLTHH